MPTRATTPTAPDRPRHAALALALACALLLALAPAAPPPARAEAPVATPVVLPVTADTFVASGAPAQNSGAATRLDVVSATGRTGPAESHALLAVRLDGLPANAIVVNAFLEIHLDRASGPASAPVLAEAALAPWEELAVTWESRPPAQGLNNPVASIDDQPGWKQIDVTRIVQNWQARAIGNHGIVLRTPVTEALVARYFAPRERPEFAPRLRVAYLTAQLPGVEPEATPEGLYRRAAQLLEEMRGSPMAPGWDAAAIGPDVYPLYRPDISGPAYYEFQVFAPGPDAAGLAAAAPPRPAGFIIVSAGEHDYPIPHWSFAGLSPTQQMQQQAQLAGKTAAKFYKLDALSYAAEDAQGGQVATVGAPLVKITGLDPAWLTAPRPISETSWSPSTSDPDITDGSVISGTVQVSGPTPPAGLTLGTWESWQALKAGYAASYGVLAEALRRDAAQEWAIEEQAARIGEVLTKGDVYTMALLDDAPPQVSLAGAGAPLVRGEMLAGPGAPPAYRITVLDVLAGGSAPLDVRVTYPGRAETVRFLIADTTPRARVYAPLLRAPGAEAPARATAGRLSGTTSWGKWQTSFVGTSSDQSIYSQIPAKEAPNTTDCWSGCGATAWSMLLTWADREAAKSGSPWSGRWGIYRQGGGKGADAVAPKTMDAGVRKMMWEIRNAIGTFCAFGNGATAPWDMDGVYKYLQGRTAVYATTSYDSAGFTQADLRIKARDAIQKFNTPAVIGTGWLSHYPLAYAYSFRSRTVQKCFLACWEETEYQRRFLVNQGWAGTDDNLAWVAADTWFAGRIWACQPDPLLDPLGKCEAGKP